MTEAIIADEVVYSADHCMALSPTDRAKIIEELKGFVPGEVTRQLDEAARNNLPTTRWKSFIVHMKEWGTLGAALGASIGIVGIMLSAIYVAVGESSKNAEFRGKVTEQLRQIDNHLNTLEMRIAAASPLDPDSQRAAKDVLARAHDVPISKPLVETAGAKFVDVADKSQDAWDTAIQFVNYRTSLNEQGFASRQLGQDTGDPLVMTRYSQIFFVQGKEHPSFAWRGFANNDQSFRFEPIDMPIEQLTREGMKTLLVKGGALRIDGARFRHVIFIGVEVHYSGGQLITEDVMFVNCTFVMDNVPATRRFGKQILLADTVDFIATKV